MKTYWVTLLGVVCFQVMQAQELFPSTEPASAMSAKSIGIRINGDFFPAGSDQMAGIAKTIHYRFNPEVMWGINKKWMVHGNLYAGNAHQTNSKFEGAGIYLKYRFLSFDEVQTHFRMAVYGKGSVISNPLPYSDINLAGDNSGYGAGLIATQLLHKLALSVTGGYLKATNNLHADLAPGQNTEALNYSLSAGYLLLPKEYKNYTQPNLNLYVELLGKTNLTTSGSYLDVAPALQLILNSIARIDLVYAWQVYGTMNRFNTQLVSIRFEYNFLNAYK
jgi:hypothetical protein